MARSVVRRARRAPAVLTVLARHVLRDTSHAARVPAPLRPSVRRPGHRQALDLLAAGELTAARDHAATLGRAGRALADLVDGDLALLTAPVPRHRSPAGSAAAPDGPARVLHLVTNALPEVVAGYTLRTQGIALAQRAAGHDAQVLTRLGFPLLKGHVDAQATVEVEGVPHHRLLPSRLPLRADAALVADVAASAAVVERLRPDVLHAHSNHVNGRVGLALRERFGLPLVYEVRGLLEETWASRAADPETARRSELYRLTRAAETSVMRAADAVVTLSESLLDEVVARGVPADRVHVVPNGVDESWLAHPAPARRGGHLTVGLGGTLNRYEGVHVLVEAVALLRRDGIDVRLLVAGDGPARAGLEKQAADLGLTDAATFTGRLSPDRLREVYGDLDVFCLPRLDLPVTRLVPPLKPIEAMALGLPVVASDLAPLRELVGADRGVLVAPGEPAAWARALSGLAGPEGESRRRALGDAARTWVAETRTWPTAAATYARVHDQITAQSIATNRGETP